MDKKIGRYTLKEILSEAGNGFLSLLFLIVIYGSVLAIMQWAFERHWILGAFSIIFYWVALILGLQDLMSPQSRFFPVRKGLSIFVLLILIGSTVFAATSFLLLQTGLAKYTAATPPDLIDLNFHYLWVFFDMLPGLEITSTLNWKPEVEAGNIWGGLPIIGFRAFVIYGLLKGLKSWLEFRNEEDL